MQTTPTSADRFDLYSQIHKGLRAYLCAMLAEMGRLDSADNQQVKCLLEQLDVLLDFCAGHLKKEDQFVHAALEARRPGATRRIAEEHVAHALAIEQLQAAMHAVACASGPAREREAARLYRALAVFVAENLIHMEFEESHHNELLWACFGDNELAEIHGAIVGATSAAHMGLGARWVVPHLTPNERDALLMGVRASMPPAVFDGMLALVEPHLPQAELNRLGGLLDIPQWCAPMDTARQRVERFLDATFVRFDVAAACKLVSADFIAHPWTPLGIPAGPAGLAIVIEALGTAFSEASVTLDDVIGADDRVVMRYAYEGRHTGDLFGIPATGRRFRLTGIAIVRLVGGKVAEYWREEDMLGLMRQLGVETPLPEAAEA
ncbi:MAG: ester cyclase [Ramlibacter sp.]